MVRISPHDIGTLKGSYEPADHQALSLKSLCAISSQYVVRHRKWITRLSHNYSQKTGAARSPRMNRSSRTSKCRQLWPPPLKPIITEHLFLLKEPWDAFFKVCTEKADVSYWLEHRYHFPNSWAIWASILLFCFSIHFLSFLFYFLLHSPSSMPDHPLSSYLTPLDPFFILLHGTQVCKTPSFFSTGKEPHNSSLPDMQMVPDTFPGIALKDPCLKTSWE